MFVVGLVDHLGGNDLSQYMTTIDEQHTHTTNIDSMACGYTI